MPDEEFETMRRSVSQQLLASARLLHEMAGQAQVVVTVAAVCASALRKGNKILFCGNGGSAADSQHLAAELVGRFRLERQALAAIALTTDTSVLTAIGNDYSFDVMFARQVAALGRSGDVLVGLSTSGRSRNVLLAIEQARRQDMITIGFTGEYVEEFLPLVDHLVRVPSRDTPRVQESHIAVGHVVCELVEAQLA